MTPIESDYADMIISENEDSTSLKGQREKLVAELYNQYAQMPTSNCNPRGENIRGLFNLNEEETSAVYCDDLNCIQIFNETNQVQHIDLQRVIKS